MRLIEWAVKEGCIIVVGAFAGRVTEEGAAEADWFSLNFWYVAEIVTFRSVKHGIFGLSVVERGEAFVCYGCCCCSRCMISVT